MSKATNDFSKGGQERMAEIAEAIKAKDRGETLTDRQKKLIQEAVDSKTVFHVSRITDKIDKGEPLSIDEKEYAKQNNITNTKDFFDKVLADPENLKLENKSLNMNKFFPSASDDSSKEKDNRDSR